MTDLRLVRIFVVVVKHASMTLAARELGLTQSAVSQAVRQLEESLGTVLIDRQRRPVVPTAAGSLLSKRGEALIEEAQTLFKTVREAGGGRAQEIRIGLIDSVSATIGGELLQAMGSATVRMSVLSGLSFDLGEAFAARKLDMLITSDPLSMNPTLERTVILREPFVLILSAKNASLARLPLADIARRLPLVRFNRGSHIAGEVDKYLERIGISMPRRYEFDSADNLAAMVATNDIWALTTPLCILQARHWRDALQIAALPPDGPVRTVYLLARPGEYGGLPGRVADIAREQFERRWAPVVRDLMPWMPPLQTR